MKLKFKKYISLLSKLSIFFISIISIKSTFINAEDYYLDEIEIDNSTKFDNSSTELPSNPFEIVDMIRRANSMNDATKPSVAVDDALKSFNKIEEENL